ncbi:MAG: hypothetical protein K9G63_13650 [Melioribacteraceae bacterium]|nr:hypothetical protein [Melioribacteraceae bacterium]
MKILFRVKLTSSVKNLIVFKHDKFLGDLIIASIFFVNAAKFDKFQKIIFVTDSKNSELFEEYSGNILILKIDSAKYKRNIFYKIKKIIEIRSHHPTHCINLNLRVGINIDELPLVCGAKTLYGLADSNSSKRTLGSLTDKYYYQLYKNSNQILLYRYRYLLEMVADEKIQVKTIIPMGTTTQGTIDTILKKIQNKKIILINPLSSRNVKNWSINNYKMLLKEIILLRDIHVILLGTKSQESQLNELVLDVSYVRNLAGKLSLIEIAKLMKHSAIFIGNDSGLFHLANAIDISFIILIGGGSYGLFYPYPYCKNKIYLYNSLPCFGCEWHCIYTEPKCMTEIKVNEVLINVKKILSREKK